MTTGLVIEEAARRLRRGEVVAVPTDTVYGLAISVAVPGARHRLFCIKGRPDAVALALLVASLDEARIYAAASDRDRLSLLGSGFWPGDLTVIVGRSVASSTFDLGGDGATIGLRVPASPVVRELARLAGPLGVSSANRHRHPPCNDADEVRAVFDGALFVVDGGRCEGAVSTVVDVTSGSPKVLREGRISQSMLEEVLGAPPLRE